MSCCFRYDARTGRLLEEEIHRDRGLHPGRGIRWLVGALFALLVGAMVLGALGL